MGPAPRQRGRRRLTGVRPPLTPPNPEAAYHGVQHIPQEFSLTISCKSKAVPLLWLTKLQTWAERFCTRAIFSVERGKQNAKPHIQAALISAWDSSKPGQEAMRKSMHRACGMGITDGAVMLLKPFDEHQT